MSQGSDSDDDGFLCVIPDDYGNDVGIPCGVASPFFDAEVELTSYMPMLKFRVGLRPLIKMPSVRLSEKSDRSSEPWCTLQNLNAEAVLTVVRALEQLQKLHVPEDVLQDSTETLPERLRAVPPVAVLCQLFAVVAEHRGFVELNENLGFRTQVDLVGFYVDALFDSLQQEDLNPHLPLFTVSEALPRVFHIRTQSRFVLAASFLRFQEHYESPDPEFRGRVFSLEQIRDKYRREGRSSSNKGWSYYLDWPGFNLPGKVVDWCEENMQPLRTIESTLLSAVRAHTHMTSPGSCYYVIGTCGDDEAHVVGKESDQRERLSTLHHEMAHGLWATNEWYRKTVKVELNKLSVEETSRMTLKLIALGYCEDVEILEDEWQAYLVSGGLGIVEEGQVAQRIRAVWQEVVGIPPVWYRNDSVSDFGGE
mmetsp:Transcript_34812/g.75656  ORF Transcript_34812/g.75656 Transcript_34812/m.75656 type:complete len:422 (+) Transcript_34812:36-1301(+)